MECASYLTKTKIVDAVSLTASAAATVATWQNVGPGTKPRGLAVYITASGSPAVTLTVRTSIFASYDPDYPAASNYSESTLSAALAKTTWYILYPESFMLPFESYTVTVAAVTANATCSVWALSIGDDDVKALDIWRQTPPEHCVSITPSDTADLANPTRGISVGVAGAVKIDTLGGDTVVVPALVAGIIHPIRARRVYSTGGTTATGIFGWR